MHMFVCRCSLVVRVCDAQSHMAVHGCFLPLPSSTLLLRLLVPADCTLASSAWGGWSTQQRLTVMICLLRTCPAAAGVVPGGPQVFDVLRCSQVSCGRVVLSPGASLTWLAFSQEGQLAAMDR